MKDLSLDDNSVCCICFSNTLKHQSNNSEVIFVFVVFVLAIPSNTHQRVQHTEAVFVVFVLAIPSNLSNDRIF